MRLEGKVAIITGAGSGMGRTAAQMFAAEGAKVVAADYDEGHGAETVGAAGEHLAAGQGQVEAAAVHGNLASAH